MISVSEDGTIAVTNLNSGEIHKLLHSFANLTNGAEKDRTERVIHEINLNRTAKRRNSISQCFSTEKFFNLVKAKSQRVFSYASFGSIERIVEVKSIQKIQENIHQQNTLKK